MRASAAAGMNRTTSDSAVRLTLHYFTLIQQYRAHRVLGPWRRDEDPGPMDWVGVHKHWPAALAAMLGIVASLSLFDHARKAAEDRVSAEFTVQAQSRARDLQEVLSHYEGTIEGFAATFPYQHLDAAQFRSYAKSVFLAS